MILRGPLAEAAERTDWSVCRIENVGNVAYGLTVNAKRREATERRPCLTVADFSKRGFDVGNAKQMGCLEGDTEKYGLQDGDILVIEGNGNPDLVGRSAIFDGDGAVVVHQNHLLRIRLDRQKMVPTVLRDYLNSDLGRRYLNPRISTSSGLSTMNSRTLRRLPIPLPPLAEQRKIAGILSTWDRAIEQTESLIAAKERLKKGLMQRLLTGKLRFPEFGPPSTETGQLPSGWKESRLRNLFKRVRRTVEQSGGDVEPLSITATVGFVSQREKFSKVIAGKQLSRYILLRQGEFAYNKGNSKSYPQGCVYRLEREEGAVPHVYYCFRADSPRVDPDFFAYCFEHGMLNHPLSRLINAGVRNDGLLNLSADDFFSVKVWVPPLAEQDRIASVLNACDRELSLLRQNLDALQQQKKGLMQKLLTGKVRVKTNDEGDEA